MPPLPRTFDNVLTAGDAARRYPGSPTLPSSSCDKVTSALKPTLTFGTDDPFSDDDYESNPNAADHEQYGDNNDDAEIKVIEEDGSYASHYLHVPLDDERSSIARSVQSDDSYSTEVPRVKGPLGMQQHNFDHIDPEAVDFEPLLTSMNGAAITLPHQSLHGKGAGGMFHDHQAYPLDSTADEEEFDFGLMSFLRSCLRGTCMKLLFGDAISTFNSLGLGQRLVFAAGFGRMMLIRKYGASKRFTRQYVAPLGSLFHGVGSANISSSGVGGGFSSRMSGMGAALTEGPSMKVSLGFCAAFFVIVAIVSTVRSSSQDDLGFSGASAVSLLMKSDTDKILESINLSAPPGIRLPRSFEATANVADQPLGITDTPVYWQIPRSGGTTMMNIVASCFAKVVASEIGELDGHATDETLQIIALNNDNFVNVDTTRPQGIARAKKLGLVPSRIAGAIFTPYVHEISSLFDHRHRGRFFTIFRDPVSRIVSMYYYQQKQGLLPAEDASIKQFVAMTEDNWMTRMLSNKMTGRIGPSELNVAKEVLRRKFLIGLWEEKSESMRRIEQYFGWKFPSPAAQNCKNDKLYFEWNNKNSHPDLENEDELVLQIQKMNRYDVELYHYAKQLFEYQSGMLWSGPQGGGAVAGNLRR